MKFEAGESGNPNGRPKGSYGGRIQALAGLDKLLARKKNQKALIAALEKDLQKDILLLLKIIKKFGNKGQGVFEKGIHGDYGIVEYPIGSYQRVIKHYLENGIYYENINSNEISTRGKINWNRTIKQVNPSWNEDEAIYLNFIVESKKINEDALFSLIHKYCIYISFRRIGWLYLNSKAEKPKEPYNRKLFLSFIANKQNETFDDKLIILLRDLKSIIEHTELESEIESSMTYGTYKFEYIWEKIIDYNYGILDKNRYFPMQTLWGTSR